MIQPPVAWSEWNSLGITGAGIVTSEAQVQGRAMRDGPTSRRHDVISPGLPPAPFHLFRKPWRIYCRQSLSKQGAEHPMDQPARAAVDQRESGRHYRVIGRVQANFLRKRKSQHHSRLAVVGKPLPRRTVNQLVEIGKASQRFTDNSARKRCVGRGQFSGSLRGIVHCLAASEDSVQHAKGGLAGLNPFLRIYGWTWHCAL
jgi:hypothetical protein